MKKIAIIGAGLSGLTIAQKLSKHFAITVFEKSRGVGGRMATRRADVFEFDHGAQYFTVKSALFNDFIQPMLHNGIISRWNARFAEINPEGVLHKKVWGESMPHFVGNPSMSRMCQHIAADLDVRLNTRIKSIKPDHYWRLFDEADNDLGIYDWVIITTPSAQAAQLMPVSFKDHRQLASIKMSGCYSLMLGFAENPELNFDAAIVKEADISWISVNSSKPGRPSQPTLLVNSTNAWAEANINVAQEVIVDHLSQELSRITGIDRSKAKCEMLQHWRYANIGFQTNHKGLVDIEQKLAACGDWCIKGRVESAFLVGCNVANQILASLN